MQMPKGCRTRFQLRKRIGAYLPVEGQGCTIPNQCETEEEAEQAQA